jgi:hypothetical protein
LYQKQRAWQQGAADSSACLLLLWLDTT